MSLGPCHPHIPPGTTGDFIAGMLLGFIAGVLVGIFVVAY